MASQVACPETWFTARQKASVGLLFEVDEVHNKHSLSFCPKMRKRLLLLQLLLLLPKLNNTKEELLLRRRRHLKSLAWPSWLWWGGRWWRRWWTLQGQNGQWMEEVYEEKKAFATVSSCAKLIPKVSTASLGKVDESNYYDERRCGPVVTYHWQLPNV